MALFGKPRLLQLVEVASRAEVLRRRRQVRGVALRAGLGAAAAVFALLMLVWLHLTGWAALAGVWGPVGAAAAVAALDLVLLLGLGLFAGRSRTDAGADEAVAVRDTALRGAMMEAQTLGGLLRRPAGGVERPRRTVRVYPR